MPRTSPLASHAVIFFPALVFMDPKSPERVEIEALRNGNLVLTDIARTKGCSQPKLQPDGYYRKLKISAASHRQGLIYHLNSVPPDRT
jgi:hypothetical protein